MKQKLRSSQTAEEIVERDFLANRARLLEVAAFLDRIDRADDADAVRDDHRYRGLLRVLGILAGNDGDRALACHRALSDLSDEPIDSAAGLGAATGAWKDMA
jgi:hypothetical protein